MSDTIPSAALPEAPPQTMLVDGVAVPMPAALAAPEPPPATRLVTGAEFVALFTPAEIAALWSADPRLMMGALKVAAQDRCNLGSDECAALMQIAVARGALTAARAAQVLAGTPPA